MAETLTVDALTAETLAADALAAEMLAVDALAAEALTAITQTIEQFSSVSRAVLFGSRAKGTNSPYSDVDIALFGNLDYRTAERIAGELDELPLVYTFDVLAYNSVHNPKLKDHIDRVGVPIFARDGNNIGN